jgi:hypothetical protein
MNNAGGKTALLTSAMLVAGMRLWMQIRGKTTTPFNEWAIGWGATFFILSLVSEASPAGAGALSLVIVLADFLKNGVALTTDISSLVTESEKGASTSGTFVTAPFSSGSQTGTTSKGGATPKTAPATTSTTGTN